MEQTVVNKRIRMVSMNDDPFPIEPNAEGVITRVDGIGNYIVKWDNGRTLSVIPTVDKFIILN